MVLSMILGSVFFNNSAPKKLNLSCIVPTLSSSSIRIDCCEMILPASSFLIIYIIVIPVSSSPSIIAWCIGAPPLYLGSNDAWTLIAPNLGALSKDSGNSWPNAAVTIKSDSKESNDSNSWESLSFSGWYTGIWCFVATLFTGGGVITFLRPTGLSGCVTTAITSCSAINISKIFVEKSGVPIKMILLIVKIRLHFSFI